MYNKVFAEIVAERQHQAEVWGNGNVAELAERDAFTNKPTDWAAYLTTFATQWLTKGLEAEVKEFQADTFRKNMVQVAALAVSAILAFDFETKPGEREEPIFDMSKISVGFSTLKAADVTPAEARAIAIQVAAQMQDYSNFMNPAETVTKAAQQIEKYILKG